MTTTAPLMAYLQSVDDGWEGSVRLPRCESYGDRLAEGQLAVRLEPLQDLEQGDVRGCR